MYCGANEIGLMLLTILKVWSSEMVIRKITTYKSSCRLHPPFFLSFLLPPTYFAGINSVWCQYCCALERSSTITAKSTSLSPRTRASFFTPAHSTITREGCPLCCALDSIASTAVVGQPSVEHPIFENGRARNARPRIFSTRYVNIYSVSLTSADSVIEWRDYGPSASP